MRGDFFRRANDHYLATRMAAFGAEIDHVIRGFDDVEVVLDHDHRVPRVDQPIEAFEQALDVGEMKACGRLIENVDGVLRALQA